MTPSEDAVLAAVLAGLPPGRAMPDVLQVGCGTGDFAVRLLDACPGVALLATDPSYELVALARERGVTAQLQDVQHLLAPDAAYDVVVALGLVDLDRGLAELRRVLRKDGRLVVTADGDSDEVESALRQHFDAVRREDLGSDPAATLFTAS